MIQTGNVANLTPKDIMKPLGLPDHLSFATEDVLIQILERHGFQIVSTHKFQTLLITPLQILKEIAKVFIPNKSSYLKYYLNYEKYKNANIYVRAKLPL